MRWRLEEIATVTGGRIVGDAAATGVITGFSIDSRVLEPGAAFVALVDARDGHDFVGAAFARGAVTAIVAHDVPDVRTPTGASAPLVVVDDPLRALGRMGTAARARVADAPLVAVAGSVGKTGTKDLTVAALAAGRRVHGSAVSLNNEAGVPLTLLAVDDTDPPAVLVNEFGERKPGDLAYLCDIARPTHAVITNVGLAHAEFLGGPEGVAREMQVVLDHVATDAFAVVDAADRARWGLTAPGAVVTVGVDGDVDVNLDVDVDVRVRAVELDDDARVRAIVESPWGRTRLLLEVRGRHQAANAAKAIAVACGFGVPLDAAVEGVEAVAGTGSRMRVLRLRSGAVVVDDTYNASPASMAAALDAFAHFAARDRDGRRIAVLGEMRELGAESVREHERVGASAVQAGVRELVVVGAAGEWIAAGAKRVAPSLTVIAVTDAPEAAAFLHDLGPHDAVLLKASRAVGLDRVVARLDDRPDAAGDVTS